MVKVMNRKVRHSLAWKVAQGLVALMIVGTPGNYVFAVECFGSYVQIGNLATKFKTQAEATKAAKTTFVNAKPCKPINLNTKKKTVAA